MSVFRVGTVLFSKMCLFLDDPPVLVSFLHKWQCTLYYCKIHARLATVYLASTVTKEDLQNCYFTATNGFSTVRGPVRYLRYYCPGRV